MTVGRGVGPTTFTGRTGSMTSQQQLQKSEDKGRQSPKHQNKISET